MCLFLACCPPRLSARVAIVSVLCWPNFSPSSPYFPPCSCRTAHSDRTRARFLSSCIPHDPGPAPTLAAFRGRVLPAKHLVLPAHPLFHPSLVPLRVAESHESSSHTSHFSNEVRPSPHCGTGCPRGGRTLHSGLHRWCQAVAALLLLLLLWRRRWQSGGAASAPASARVRGWRPSCRPSRAGGLARACVLCPKGSASTGWKYGCGFSAAEIGLSSQASRQAGCLDSRQGGR